jgi:hypothetical protein
VFRLRHSNAAEAAADQGSDHQSRVQQVGHLEQRAVRRHLSSKVRHRSQNMLGLQGENWAKVQLPVRVERAKFRPRGASKNLSVNGSARRRLQAQVNVSSVAEVRRLDFINR